MMPLTILTAGVPPGARMCEGLWGEVPGSLIYMKGIIKLIIPEVRLGGANKIDY